MIKYNIYSAVSFLSSQEKTTTKEYRYPLSILNRTKKKKVKKIKNEIVERLLKDRIVEVVENWKVENAYAISLLIYGEAEIFLDYNEETEGNSELQSEQRWNYAYWQQNNSFELLRDSSEKALLKKWLTYLDYNQEKDDTVGELIDNPNFTNLIIKVMNEVRSMGIIKKTFGKEIPIIIHNFEYYDYVIELTKKVNEKNLIADFLKWCETIIDFCL